LDVIRVAVVCCVLLALWAGSCRGTRPATSLTILAINTTVGRAVFHVDCAPAGGDLPDPARACAALAATPALITRPKRFVCAGATFSWWDVWVSGRFDGRPIQRTFSTCWTPQMPTIGRLGLSWKVLQAHLLPRRHEALEGHERRTFGPGRLRPADLVTCDIRGHRLDAGVPVEFGAGELVGYGSAKLTVARHPDGSVTATCG
jgi:hypothetical protein